MKIDENGRTFRVKMYLFSSWRVRICVIVSTFVVLARFMMPRKKSVKCPLLFMQPYILFFHGRGIVGRLCKPTDIISTEYEAISLLRKGSEIMLFI